MTKFAFLTKMTERKIRDKIKKKKKGHEIR